MSGADWLIAWEMCGQPYLDEGIIRYKDNVLNYQVLLSLITKHKETKL